MNRFKRLFRHRGYSEAHYARAEALVEESHRFALSSYRAMLERFPGEVNALRTPYDSFQEFMDYWTAFVAAASIGAAYSMMSDIPEKDRSPMSRAIEAAADEWKKGTYDLMVEHLYHMKNAMPDEVRRMPIEYARLVAVWALLKLRGRGTARRAEAFGLPFSLAFADALGSRIMTRFAGWWRERRDTCSE